VGRAYFPSFHEVLATEGIKHSVDDNEAACASDAGRTWKGQTTLHQSNVPGKGRHSQRLTVDQNWWLLIRSTCFLRRRRHRRIHVLDKAEQGVRATRYIEIRPRDALNLSDLVRRDFRVISIGEQERPLDRWAVLGWWIIDIEKVEAGHRLFGFIDAAFGGYECQLVWSILSLGPVVAAFDGSAFELFREPGRDSQVSLRNWRVDLLITYITITWTFCSHTSVQKSRYVASIGP
jgi:hypothetical protein